MVRYNRDESALLRDDSLTGAPLYQAKYRCTLCSQPIKQKFAGPSGLCYNCAYEDQDIRPIDRIEAVSIYYPERAWGSGEGPVIEGLMAFSREIQQAKQRRHTEKMAEILGYGIVSQNYQNFDLVMIPPSSDDPNHMTPKAEAIEEEFEIPFEDAIVEIEETGELKNQNAAERAESTEDNYLCQTNVEGERVILLDDVVTTTNTITGVATAVEDRGASQIVSVAMARTVDLRGLKYANLVVEVDD